VGRSGDPFAPNKAKEYLADLDDWENAWFPVVSATLERHYPALHATIFKNLSQTSGAEVIVSVGTLLDRLDTMKASEAGKKADALLVTRGLTTEVRAQASKLIDTIKQTEETVLPEIDPASKAEQEKALDKVWAWYREWSQIARTVIKRGDVLIRLGLRQPNRGSSEASGVTASG